MQVSDIHISDEMMDPENREDLQDMLISCLNKAIEKAKAEKEEKMKAYAQEDAIAAHMFEQY